MKEETGLKTELEYLIFAFKESWLSDEGKNRLIELLISKLGNKK